MKVTRVRRLGNWISGLTILGAIMIVFFNTGAEGAVIAGLATTGPLIAGMLALACTLYGLAHVLRAIRLYLILGVGSVNFTALLGCQAVVSIASAAIPFKGGELIRVYEVCRVDGRFARGLAAVWLDRLFDSVFLLAGLILLIWHGSQSGAVQALMAITGLFLLGSLVAVLIVPGMLRAFRKALMSSSSPRSLRLMRLSAKVSGFFKEIPVLDRELIALLTLTTCFIWLVEAVVVILIVMAIGEPVTMIATRLATILVGAGGTPSLETSILIYRGLALVALGGLSVICGPSWIAVRRRFAGTATEPSYVLRPLFESRPLVLSERIR